MTLWVFDFETELFGPGRMAPPPACLAWWGPNGSEPIVVPELEAEAVVSKMLAGPADVLIVGANVAYDMGVICARWPHLLPAVFKAYALGRVRDVLIRQKLIDIAAGEYRRKEVKPGVWIPHEYSLAALTNRLCGRELAKEDTPRLQYGRLRQVPFEQWPPEAIEYPKGDVQATRDVYLMQERELVPYAELNILNDEPAQCRADFALSLMSAWGLRTDQTGVELLRASCEKRQAELLEILAPAGLVVQSKKKGELVWARKMKPAQERILEAAGGDWTKLKLTKTGKKKRWDNEPWQVLKYAALDEEACRDSNDDVLIAYSEYNTIGTLLSGHVKAMEKGIHLPIHSRFEVLLETGRTSSSAPNVQNVRRAEGARECFKPRDGYCFVGCDFDKAELHTLSQVCINVLGVSELAEELNAGEDPHLAVGAQLAHISLEEAKRLYAAGDEMMREWRQRAKPANFGFPGGMGAPGMQRYAKTAYGVVLSMKEAEHLYESWKTSRPVVVKYLEWIREQMNFNGVGTVKHFVSERYRGQVGYTVAANSYFQGMAADGAKHALWSVVRRCYEKHPGSALYGCRPVNFVHDEIILEVPLDGRLTDAAIEMRDVMVESFNVFTPDVPVRATPCAMDRWSKKAKTLWGPNQELQVWHYETPA